MFERRTLQFFAAFVAGFALLSLPGLVWPGYLDTPIGIVVALPWLSVYLFHTLGIPGLLEHGGACGWGWCAPTAFGWAFTAIVWLLACWLLAWGAARASDRPGPRS
jgi:hypothetical protein